MWADLIDGPPIHESLVSNTGSEKTSDHARREIRLVSTAGKNQTVNQLRDLLAVARRQDWEVVATFTDESSSPRRCPSRSS